MDTKRAPTRMTQPAQYDWNGVSLVGAPLVAPDAGATSAPSQTPDTPAWPTPATFARSGIEPLGTDVPLRMVNLSANYHEARLQRLVGEVSQAEARLAYAQQAGDENAIALRRSELELARDAARSVRWWLATRAPPSV